MSIKKISGIGCLVGLMGLNSFATIVSFQQGDLRKDGAGISGAYQTDVTHVISSTLSGNNYNSPAANYMGTSSAAVWRHLLLGFDLSYLETVAGGSAYTINSVELKLTQYSLQPGSGPSTFAMHVTDAFDETTATWDNTGAGGGTVGSLLSTKVLDTTSAAGTAYSFTGANWITAVEAALADPSNTFYALGKRQAEGGGGNYFVLVQSDEGATHGIDGRPELIVDMTVIPEPGTLGMAAAASLGLIFLRRKFSI